MLNRQVFYPRWIRRQERDFDVFHVVDHSYAALVHALPPHRTGVYCHDLDAFRCLLSPRDEPRPRWFRWLARRTLKGLQKAAVVFYSTQAVRTQIEQHGLIDSSKLVWAPYGIAPEFTLSPEETANSDYESSSGPEAPFVLHVGSCIPRKRMDVLLEVFARVRRDYPELRLIQVGGTWNEVQLRQIEQLQLGGVIVQRRGLSRAELAKHYRKARLVLQPSEAEGFGLPVAEALACGAVVVASDLPVLREVGGDAAVYVPVGNIPAWSETICHLLARPGLAPAPENRAQQAAQFSWGKHARTIAEAYQRLLVQAPFA
jgi:glycosyltransferase involved in cell wall biosynthesis